MCVARMAGNYCASGRSGFSIANDMGEMMQIGWFEAILILVMSPVLVAGVGYVLWLVYLVYIAFLVLIHLVIKTIANCVSKLGKN